MGTTTNEAGPNARIAPRSRKRAASPCSTKRQIYLSLGSNLGNRLHNLRRATEELRRGILTHLRFSLVIETESIFPPGAPDSWNLPFLNMVIAGETHLAPEELLQALKTIEFTLGRPTEYERWAPRLIDLDILIWEGVTYNSPTLTLPHKELPNRPFFIHLLALMGYSPGSDYCLNEAYSKNHVLYPQLVGVVNVTSDSFSDGGEFNQLEQAVGQVERLADEGASLIELGAQSTRPGASLQSPEQELAKLHPILEALTPLIRSQDLKISIDTFWPSVVSTLLALYPIHLINDVSGTLEKETLQLIADKGVKYCVMHALGIPPTKERVLPLNSKPTESILEWGKEKVSQLLEVGFSPQQIVLDPGIGFGKTPYQNIQLLRSISEMKQGLDVQWMIGHSRKSFIKTFSKAEAPHRDLETVALSCAIGEQADYLRVHAVGAHMRALTAYQAVKREVYE